MSSHFVLTFITYSATCQCYNN